MAAVPTFISAKDVNELLDQKELLDSLEVAFGNFSRGPDGGVIQPVRSVIEVSRHKGFFGTMPAYSENDDAMATKILSFYPENLNPPRHTSHVLLFDPKNGTLLAIVDGNKLTEIRTAIASAVASKHLANPASKILAILGSGGQARSHYSALSTLYSFSEVRVCSRTRSHAETLAAEIGAQCCATVEDCVRGADIICTTTFATTPVLEQNWVKLGAHINAVGACRANWSELSPDLMRSAVVYVDTKDGCMKESGDIILSEAKVFAEIGEVVNGSKPAHWEQTTIFKSVGMALEDLVAAKIVYTKYKLKYAK